MDGPHLSHRQFVERLVIALLVLGFALLLWNLRGLLILLFGAVLVAVVLNLVARPFRTRLRFPSGLALLCAVLVVLGIFGTAFWMFGAEVIRQASALSRMVPQAWEAVQLQLAEWGLGQVVQEWRQMSQSGGGVLSSLSGILMSIGNGLADALLVIVAGIYLAAQPDLYRTGLIKLVPDKGRGLAAQALDASGRALKLWLLGRLVSMTVVGVLTWIGLSVLGVPSALTLGLLAAILEFVPFIGPIVASIPAILLAFAHSPQLALWTAGLFLAIQQFEGNVLEPVVQQHAVDLPPALLLFALVAGGLVFGVVGILFAAPLTVVLYVLVKRLYVKEALHTETRIPGED